MLNTLSENNYKAIKELKDIEVFLLTEKGHVLGYLDSTELDSLPWIKKIIAKYSRKYRNKFIKSKPFKVDLIHNYKSDTYNKIILL